MLAIYDFRWLLFWGALITVRIFLASAALAAVLAFCFGLARQSQNVWVRSAAACWVDFFRGVSTVVLLFWLYFALPFLGISLPAEIAAILGLGLVHGAYNSESVRGALQSIDRGQAEAAAALGLSRWRILRLVILPQAFVRMLPPLGNGLILLLKGTSIASTITVAELTAQSSLIVTRTMAVFPVFLCVLVIYYAGSLSIAAGMRRLERHAARWRKSGARGMA